MVDRNHEDFVPAWPLALLEIDEYIHRVSSYCFPIALELESSFRPSSHVVAGEIWGFLRFFYMCLVKDWTQMLTNFHISTKVSLRSSYVSFLWRAAGLGLVSSIGTLG